MLGGIVANQGAAVVRHDPEEPGDQRGEAGGVLDDVLVHAGHGAERVVSAQAMGDRGIGVAFLGGLVLFWNPDKSRVLDAVTYDAQGYGVSSGRWPDGGDEFYPMLQATPGAPNGQIRIDDVVITFADITTAKTLEAELRQTQAGLEKRVADQATKRDHKAEGSKR